MNLRYLILSFVSACFFMSTAALASSTSEAALAADPVAEKRLQVLSEELRCLVCQNQTIADSNAELAQDLRHEIRGMIAGGKSDKEIIDFMVARYGDFVLYKPALTRKTAVLWFGPLALLVGGLVVIGVIVGRRRRTEQTEGSDTLSAEERKRLDTLLDKTKDD